MYNVFYQIPYIKKNTKEQNRKIYKISKFVEKVEKLDKLEKTEKKKSIPGPLRIKNFFPFLFRDGEKEKGKKNFFKATRFLIEKYRKKRHLRLYKRHQYSIRYFMRKFRENLEKKGQGQMDNPLLYEAVKKKVNEIRKNNSYKIFFFSKKTIFFF
jgi:hypothetical protein